eukprot:3500291-Amphidinium_carterae.1
MHVKCLLPAAIRQSKNCCYSHSTESWLTAKIIAGSKHQFQCRSDWQAQHTRCSGLAANSLSITCPLDVTSLHFHLLILLQVMAYCKDHRWLQSSVP